MFADRGEVCNCIHKFKINHFLTLTFVTIVLVEHIHIGSRPYLFSTFQKVTAQNVDVTLWIHIPMNRQKARPFQLLPINTPPHYNMTNNIFYWYRNILIFQFPLLPPSNILLVIIPLDTKITFIRKYELYLNSKRFI